MKKGDWRIWMLDARFMIAKRRADRHIRVTAKCISAMKKVNHDLARALEGIKHDQEDEP